MTRVRMAIAAAITAAAGTSAHAIDISLYNPATAVSLYLSGSTEGDVNSELLSAETTALAGPNPLCAPSTADVYQGGAGPNPGVPAQRSIFCAANTQITGITAGTPIFICKESTVGSVNGVQPLININKGLPSGVTCISPTLLIAAGGSSACSSTTGLPGFTLHANCAGNITAPPPAGSLAGISDIEGTLLRLQGDIPLNADDIHSRLSMIPGFDTVWGVPITKNLYYALQAAEGLTAKCPSPGTGTFLDSPSCAPTLSMGQVASLYTATGLVTWDQIIGLNNPTGDNNVYVCSRDIGSGTEASFEAYFLGARCSVSDEVVEPEDGQFVFASGYEGNVRHCMQAFFSGGMITPYNQNTLPVTTFPPVVEPGGQWAIGMLTTELSAADLSAAGDSIRMVAVDGVLPTLDNTSNSFWRYFTTDMFYTIRSGAGVLSGASRALLGGLAFRFGNPATLALNNTGYVRPWGNGGDLSPASVFGPGANPATAAKMTTAPVNSFAKVTGAAPGATINNCDTLVLLNSNGGTNLTAPPAILLGNGNVNN